jgi:UDP-glucose 4-epimerase
MTARPLTLVTGGAGFIGSELVRQLAARGDRVVIIDNLVNGTRQNVAEVLSGSVELLEHDIRDTRGYAILLREVGCVYHLACLGVRHSVHSPYENHDVNATGTLRLLEECRRAAVPRFVHVSSSEVYGTARWVPMTEDHPTSPSTVYGGSKLAGESYARAFHHVYGHPTIVVRPFNTYGPRSHHEGDSGEVIPKFLLRCLAGKPMVVFGDGTQTRDFTDVSDTARGILLAGSSDRAIGETINLGRGAETSINDLAAAIARTVGRAPQVVHDVPRPGDVHRLFADASRARALLGYEPRVSLSDGLTKLLEWYRAKNVDPEELLRDEIVRNWTTAQVRSEKYEVGSK